MFRLTLSIDNKGYLKVPFPCFPLFVSTLGVHSEVKYFLLDCSSKNIFTGNYCSKLSVKLTSVIYNHNPESFLFGEHFVLFKQSMCHSPLLNKSAAQFNAHVNT